MIVLDSDHLSILQHPASPQYERLVAAMEQSADLLMVTTVISLEEQARGWLAAINRGRTVHDQLPYYLRLTGLVEFYARWEVVPFNDVAAECFLDLRRQGIRVGTMDLKIASIVLANSALLLSANSQDFERVPGLRIENWLQ